MAAQADAKAQKALGENAATLVGIGKEAFETETPGIIKTVYEAEISEDWPRMQFCQGGLCCPHRILERTYVKVQENRIEANYPILCCGVCALDNTKVTYFDRSLGNFTESKFCTPGHLCLFVPFSGTVVKDTKIAAAEPDYLNLFCVGANHFYPGLTQESSETFIAKAKEAHTAWKAKHANAKPSIAPEAAAAPKDDAVAGEAAAAPAAAAAAPDAATEQPADASDVAVQDGEKQE